jgi:RNA polymerase sigma factor (sigma-70 family)
MILVYEITKVKIFFTFFMKSCNFFKQTPILVIMNAKRFTEWVDQYSDRIFRFVVKGGISKMEAEDMVQNCFEALWKKDLDDETSAGKYLFGVAHHQMADYYERSSKRKTTNNIPELMTQPISVDIKTLLYKELNNLSAQWRSLILLKDLEGFNYEEIGQITSLKPAQVKVYLHRARLQMQKNLGPIHKII